MSLELREFRVEDYLEINRRKFEMLTFLQFPDAKEVAKRLAMGPAYTIANSASIIASGGIVPFWKNVGEAWIVSSESLPQHKFYFIKTVLKKLQELGRNYDRIQTTIDAENVVSMKWAEWIGFECEGDPKTGVGLMRKFIGGRDYWRYALVRS